MIKGTPTTLAQHLTKMLAAGYAYEISQGQQARAELLAAAMYRIHYKYYK